MPIKLAVANPNGQFGKRFAELVGEIVGIALTTIIDEAEVIICNTIDELTEVRRLYPEKGAVLFGDAKPKILPAGVRCIDTSRPYALKGISQFRNLKCFFEHFLTTQLATVHIKPQPHNVPKEERVVAMVIVM